MTACAQDKPIEIAADSARRQAEAKVVDEAIKTTVEAARVTLPPYPTDCRRQERSGAVIGERQDALILKQDAALDRQNQRVARCADWYDKIRASHGAGR